MGLFRAGTVEHKLVLCIADIDPLVVPSAGVSARGRAGRRQGSLLSDSLAVGDVSDVGAPAAVGAGSDLLDSCVSPMHRGLERTAREG